MVGETAQKSIRSGALAVVRSAEGGAVAEGEGFEPSVRLYNPTTV